MVRIAEASLFILSVLFALLTGCGNDAPPSSSPSPASLTLTKTMYITTDAEGGSARPEIAATDDRVFVLYLAHLGSGMTGKTFDLKVFSSDLASTITSTTIVANTETYGSPTDIRIAADGQYLFTFYETSTTGTTFLHGEKRLLNDSFDVVAKASEPIASSLPVFQLAEGGEVLNDPAPLVTPSSVAVITRLWSSISATGATVYRVREFSKDDLSLIGQFDLDLSSVADGRGRVTSLLSANGFIYMALATSLSYTVTGTLNSMSDDGGPCDIILLRMASDWSFDLQTDVFTITAEQDDRENYITGLRTDGTRFYLSYKQAIGAPPTGEQRSVIKVYDRDLALITKETVRSIAWGPAGGEMRPSLELHGNKVFSGQSTGQGMGTGNGELFVYEWK